MEIDVPWSLGGRWDWSFGPCKDRLASCVYIGVKRFKLPGTFVIGVQVHVVDGRSFGI